MKKLLLVTLTSSSCLWSAPLRPLPETIATVDGKEIKSAKIQKVWEKSLLSLPEDISPETAQRLYRKLVDEAVWQREIAIMLAEHKIKPDRKTAEKYLNSFLQGLSAERVQFLKLHNLRAPDAPEMQLKAAIHFYLKKTVPEEVAVSDQEIEAYYRKNQLRFKQPAKVRIGILEIQDREKAKMARASLLQGASFDAVARLYAPEGDPPEMTQEILDRVKTMRPGEVSELRRNKNKWQIIQLRSRIPAKFRPLEEAAPLIKLELSSAKEGLALTQILRQRLADKQIRYTPLPR